MLPEEFSEWVAALFTRFNYIAPFVVLLLCGVGLPLPEEVTLIGSGILLHRGDVEFLEITLTCSAAILLGDSIPFWLGRRYGMSALQHRFVRRVLHPERLSKLEQRFREHGNWATFVCRFFAGVRIPGYFLAGSMRMSYPRFLLLDSLGVLISVPASIYLGKMFGSSMDQLKQKLGDLHLILGFLVLALVLLMLWKARGRRKVEPPPPAPPAP
ncbi:MAG: DedA family protein [Planctomycetes bacterium]|jgi:membrane protein DedA with SNARE-associated domain|nr:DedA family protein [Planctomycetota bacterium]